MDRRRKLPDPRFDNFLATSEKVPGYPGEDFCDFGENRAMLAV
jgi:hypothetical protein